MFSFAIVFPTLRFLQAQSKVKVIMCIAFVVLLIQNGLLYMFIHVFGWGVTGLAMVSNIVGWLYAVALVVYTIGWNKEEWRVKVEQTAHRMRTWNIDNHHSEDVT
ncbi:hypothetical protein V8G54_012639 [Vigna mungo]|uniref:Uncharacterized protein n=1 Tax=Vigna mungo TaxID=3915 RepID=A0AAQ3NTB1_VIGMU